MKSESKNFTFSFSTLDGLIAVSKHNFCPAASPSCPWPLEAGACFGFARLECFLALLRGRAGGAGALLRAAAAGPLPSSGGWRGPQRRPPGSDSDSGAFPRLPRGLQERLAAALRCFLWCEDGCF